MKFPLLLGIIPAPLSKQAWQHCASIGRSAVPASGWQPVTQFLGAIPARTIHLLHSLVLVDPAVELSIEFSPYTFLSS